jgi:ABC-type phosphate/phosphonate transport system substrate-binding protein
MNRPTNKFSALLVIGALVCGLTAASGAAQPLETAKPQTVSLGLIAETNRAQIAERFNGFVRYVASKLDPPSEIEGKVLIAPTPFQLAKLIEQKKVDLYGQPLSDLSHQRRPRRCQAAAEALEGRHGGISEPDFYQEK